MAGVANTSNGRVTAELATRKRALALGAQFIENDLADLRYRIQAGERSQVDFDLDRTNDENMEKRPHTYPATTSHEGDFLKAIEWASAAAILRLLSELEEK